MDEYILGNRTYFPVEEVDFLVSDDLLRDLTFAKFAVFIGLVSALGVGFNLVNVCVFLRLGFKDSLNISLFGLAIADLGSLLPLMWTSACHNPLVIQTLDNMDILGVERLTAGWPHVCFTRITGWLTAFITFERYLCVALPLKVKTIVTPKRKVAVVVAIFVIMLTSVLVIYIGIQIGPVSEQNTTLIGLVYQPNGRTIENIAIFFSAITQFLAVTSVTVWTIGLVSSLRQKSKWRKDATITTGNDRLSSRDTKAAKMVVTISVIFMIGYLPFSVSILGSVFGIEEYIRSEKRYGNLILVISNVFFCLQSVNPAISMFVYLIMSSKYRGTFRAMFTLRFVRL